MNFYPFHLGDYAAHTKHLNLLEDLAYRRMIDLYYTSEKPLPLDPEKVARLIGMRDHMQEVSDVLSDFFVKSEDGYINSRCDKEIETYRAKADRAKSANKARWGADKSDTPIKSDMKSDADRIPTKNQEPITKNQEPKSKAESATATRLPADWKPSVDDIEFCKTARRELEVIEVASRFRDYWIAQPGAKGRKLDWPATWRNWVRNEKSQPRASPAGYESAKDRSRREASEGLTGRKQHGQRSEFIDINPTSADLVG
jgi:uncharacterized protein YdaU (DUF1376 family)